MTIANDRLSDPTVRSLVTAINANDRAAFLALLAPDATMSDDGTERDLEQWIDREIFSSHGHLEVRSEADAGRTLVADYRNDTWGEMRTRWRFTVAGNKITHFATGQA
ncbi:nuclear transport factor 2 family protein [Kitasatospora sp. McL0602]|uniref:nuclear transport factor 2 family protein n=1 Tax=Kitasatospora sp. McL0602 TaxID=3439530 RepID=UPI003F8CAC92